VRQAIQELALEEKVVRVPGKGTFITQPKIEPLTALTSFSENMRAQGLEPSYRQARVVLSDPPPRVRTVFRLGKEDQVVHIHRVLLADGAPMAIQEEFLPHSIYQRNSRLFTPEVLNGTSLYNLLERELDVPLVRAEEYVDASTARPSEAELLAIKPGDLVLVITRITFTTDNSPIEFVKLIFRADRYRYRVELFRPRA
jgi:GntR family transcriptional regulator